MYFECTFISPRKADRPKFFKRFASSGVATTSKVGKTSPMPRPRKNADRKAPRRATVDEELAAPAEALMKRLRIRQLTTLVNMALREKLEREGLWPVASNDDTGGLKQT
jgi:hypothetical protein